MTYDLLSLVFTLKPVPNGKAAGPVPPWWGRAAHALLLDAVRQANPELAQSLHDEDGPRPFTASTVIGPFPNRSLDETKTYTLRYTATERKTAQSLWEAASSGPLAPGSLIRLDDFAFKVVDVAATSKQHPWAAATRYPDLAAGELITGRNPSRKVTLLFTSPTTFRTQGRNMPWPLPHLVFGNLLDRWNAYAPLAFPEELRRYAEECLAIERFNLSSRVVAAKSGGLRIGCVGRVTYVTLSYDRYWMSLIHTLSRFALFSGVGAATSAGLGQCKAEASSAPAPTDA